MENMTHDDTVTVSEIIMAVDAIDRAVRTAAGRLGVIAALSDRFNPELVEALQIVHDNHGDKIERMREMFAPVESPDPEIFDDEWPARERAAALQF